MATSNVTSGLGYFPDPTVGRPVSNGFVFVGKTDLDPEILANQKQVTLVLEDGSSVQVGQPLRTGAGGVVLYNGDAVQVTVEDDYSVLVKNSSGTQVMYVPRVSGTTGGLSGQDFSQVVDDGAAPGNFIRVLGLISENKYNRWGGTGNFEYQVNTDAAVSWNDDTEIFFHIYGAGSITVIPFAASGVTINYPVYSGDTADQMGDHLSLKKVGVNEWDLTVIQDSGAQTELLLIDGTESDPSSSYISDPDTGTFLQASGSVGVTSNGSEVARFYSGGLQVDNGSGLGDVAIEGTSPTFDGATFLDRVNVGNNGAVTNSSDPMVNVNRAVDDSAGVISGHCFSDSSEVNRAGNISYSSFDARFTVEGSNSYNHFAPYQNGPVYNTTGTIGITYGFVDGPTQTAGTISTRYGVFIADVGRSGGALLTENYGIYVNELTADGPNAWAFVAKGSGSKVLFEGRVVNLQGIGSANVSTSPLGWDISPSVSGGMRISGKVGTSYDMSIMRPGQTAFIQTNLTGTDSMKFWGNVSFNGAEPAAKPTVTGSKGGNAALASLITALEGYGLIVDSTT